MASLALFVGLVAGLWWPGCQAIRLHSASTQLEASRNVESSVFDESNILKIRKHAGLYADKQAHPEFANTVLVTFANSAYNDVLKNWRCHADRFGLDYLVLALDPALVDEIGSERTMLVEGSGIFNQSMYWRQEAFNQMSCRIVRTVKDILRATGLNVVLSDSDNVFAKDPFARNVSLGAKMRQGAYDLIYQQNHGYEFHDGQWSLTPPDAEDVGAEVVEGNTGFYFVSGASKAKGVQAMFDSVLTECQRHPEIDGQPLFWDALARIRNGTGRAEYGGDNFACADLCGKGKTCSAPSDEVLSYCEMDPWNHATGWKVSEYTGPKEVVSFHANFCSGMEEKVGKLFEAGFWDEMCVWGAPVISNMLAGLAGQEGQ
mmetsp:Transcript_65043/g.173400  ORF Transcript_65043/g.173400 Transcript_65043/m.173400 type:complete len:374 (-) Transcript_65043:56-1177(-)